MATPRLTRQVAKAIYEYAGTDGLINFNKMSPTVQISYIEEAEAALEAVSDYIISLSKSIDASDPEELLVLGTLNSLAEMIDPRSKE